MLLVFLIILFVATLAIFIWLSIEDEWDGYYGWFILSAVVFIILLVFFFIQNPKYLKFLLFLIPIAVITPLVVFIEPFKKIIIHIVKFPIALVGELGLGILLVLNSILYAIIFCIGMLFCFLAIIPFALKDEMDELESLLKDFISGDKNIAVSLYELIFEGVSNIWNWLTGY